MATFSTFRNREKLIAADLLTAWAIDAWAGSDDHLNDDAAIEFNPNSGLVYLVDDDYAVAVLNDKNQLENWLTCGDCGAEGLRSEVSFVSESQCADCAKKERHECNDPSDAGDADGRTR